MKVFHREGFVGLVRREGNRITCWELTEDCLDQIATARREIRLRRAGLTEREREVVGLLLVGRTHREIGMHLSISARTVRFHQGNALEKLGAESRADLPRVLV